MRSAARAANFHHSSMQNRITRISQTLGVDIRSAAGRERIAVAMLLWRVFRSPMI
ncbi:helix-turn-helix domain-containing protein [Microbacterium hydrothermale]|uniref:helix-turn-helix domain-containing protein n=1 Tax=Microbacterium hydrothermale TaxID=857427 RepID=UPI0038735B96